MTCCSSTPSRSAWRACCSGAATLMVSLIGAAGFPVWAADGHGASAAPVAAKSGAPDLSVDELRGRLAARMAEVKPAHESSPSASKSAHGASPRVSTRAAHATPTRVAKAEPKSGHDREVPQGKEAHGATSGHAGAHWGYGAEGSPAAWGALKPEYLMCGIGTRQSPIDIRAGIRVDLAPIEFDYRPSGFNVIDNGHTVQANIGYGNAITVNGHRYDLVQFHFHRPSEERVNGRAFDMVIHMVHKDVEGHLAVVAVLLEQGGAHPIIQQVWNSLPLEKNQEMTAPAPTDPAALLPSDRRYYTYMGSLTTPPCTEGVLWLVLKQPVQVSPEQLGIFARLYPMNARPVQPLAGRMIKESN
jgi:carbonic anhydrase